MTRVPRKTTPDLMSHRQRIVGDSVLSRACGIRDLRRHTLKQIYGIVWIALAILLVGCGTVATPVWQAPTETETRAIGQEAAAPTLEATSLPTDTPIPPTTTDTPQPTATSTPEPTLTPEPTATEILSPLDRMVSMRDPQKGAILFETFQETAGTGYSCANCHSATSEEKLVGPGLLNIKSRALTRIEGQSAAEYIYNSIVDPKEIVVEDYDPELMPDNWSEIYTNLEIFDIVAYLLTLEGDGAGSG